MMVDMKPADYVSTKKMTSNMTNTFNIIFNVSIICHFWALHHLSHPLLCGTRTGTLCQITAFVITEKV